MRWLSRILCSLTSVGGRERGEGKGEGVSGRAWGQDRADRFARPAHLPLLHTRHAFAPNHHRPDLSLPPSSPVSMPSPPTSPYRRPQTPIPPFSPPSLPVSTPPTYSRPMPTQSRLSLLKQAQHHPTSFLYHVESPHPSPTDVGVLRTGGIRGNMGEEGATEGAGQERRGGDGRDGSGFDTLKSDFEFFFEPAKGSGEQGKFRLVNEILAEVRWSRSRGGWR